MGKIAFIGATGCGKTVLLTVLTQKYVDANQPIQFTPDSRETNKYILGKWNDLRSGKWPAPTPPALNPPTYSWTITQDDHEETFVTSDIAGEAWQEFISENIGNSNTTAPQQHAPSAKQYKSKWERLKNALNPFEIEKIQNNIESLEALLQDASGIAIIVNLDAIINQTAGYEEQVWMPVAVQKYLKRNNRSDVPVALILSQCDKYQYLLQGSSENLNDVIKQYLPFSTKIKTILPVAAVANTVNGKPKANFSSNGLEPLIDWMMNAIQQERHDHEYRQRSTFIKKSILLCIVLGCLIFIGRKMYNIITKPGGVGDIIINTHQPKSYILKAISIESYGSWDPWPYGEADIYIQIDGSRHNKEVKVDHGNITFIINKPINPNSQTQISVWDEDKGITGGDDYMGTITIQPEKDFSWPSLYNNDIKEQKKQGTIDNSQENSGKISPKGINYTIWVEAQY